MIKEFFNSNNERVRVHSRNSAKRVLNYYDDIISSFPAETRIGMVKERDDVMDMTPQEALHMADNYYNAKRGYAKDDAASVKYFLFAAEHGIPSAMNQMGIMYAAGEGGLPKDGAKSKSWTEKHGITGV